MEGERIFQEGKGWNTFLDGQGPEYNTCLRAYARDNANGSYRILFLEKIPKGTYCIPYDWEHVVQVKDHKEKRIK